MNLLLKTYCWICGLTLNAFLFLETNLFPSVLWKRFGNNDLLEYCQNEYSEQWALACGEILRILTHYNRPVYKTDLQEIEVDRSNSGSHVSTSTSTCGEPSFSSVQHERKPLRPLSPWITDILLAAPLGIRSDYFRWLVGQR